MPESALHILRSSSALLCLNTIGDRDLTASQENPSCCEKGLGSCQDQKGVVQGRRRKGVAFVQKQERKSIAPIYGELTTTQGPLWALYI